MAINPTINLPKLPDISKTAEQLLNDGNYAYAFHKAETRETKALAQIMCGAIDSGLADLAEIENLSDEANLIKAYGHWCLGEAENALECIKGGEDEKTRQLRKYISDGAEILLYTMPGDEAIESFENIDISHQWIEPEHFGEQAALNYPGVDLILSLGAFGPYLPTDVYEQNCPTVFWVGDHDFFYATRSHDLATASVLIANSAGEHLELAEHYAARVASFPGHETYGRSDEFPDISNQKEYDIGYTGRAFVPYMRDKAQFLYGLATLDDSDLNISIRDGYLADEDYIELLQRSKFVPLFWRYAGGIQTRAIDALRQRAFVFSPETLTTGELLGGEEAGFVSLTPGAPTALNQITGYEPRSDKYTQHEDQFSDQFKDLFWPRPARDHRFIKFCLFQSIFTDRISNQPEKSSAVPVELRGYAPERAIRVYTAISKKNIAEENKTVSHYNYAAAAAFYAASIGAGNEKLARYALDVYGLGQGAYPENMVLKFNAARAMWIFGTKPEAAEIFGDLARSNDDLVFDAKDALLGHRVQPLADMFSYGDYYKAALQDPAAARAMLQSSALTYLGALAFETSQAEEAKAFLEKAVVLSSVNFPAYRWLTEVLDELEAAAFRILSAFYQAVNLYPPELRQLLPFGVAAELASGNEEKAADLLNQWVLFHLRVRNPEGDPLPINPKSLGAVTQHRALLKDWIREAFDQMLQETAH